MVRLPQASDLARRQNPAESPGVRAQALDYSPNATAGNAIAGAMKSVGSGIDAYVKAEQEVDDYATRKAVLDFKLQSEMDYEDHKRNMPAGGSGFSGSWGEVYQDKARQFVGEKDSNIPASQRAKVGLILKQHEVTLAERAKREELAESDRSTVEGLEQTLGTTKGVVESDHTRRDEMLTEGQKLIEQAPITPAAKDRLRRVYAKQVDQTAATSRLMKAQTAEDFDAIRKDLAPNVPDRAVNFRPEINAVIDNAAAKHGLDPALLRRIAKIESGGDPTNTTGSYKGLFQLSDAEFSKHGGSGSIYDPAVNADVAARKLKAEMAGFEAKHGRPPSPTELYMVHQQGDGGTAAHLARPNAPAWQNMASTGEGRQKGEKWAKLAIWGNIPDQDKRRFGSVENVTSRDFIELWDAKVNASGDGDGYRGPYSNLSIGERKALFTQVEGQRAKLTKSVMDEIKEYEGNAAQGYLPPEPILQALQRKAQATGDPLVAAQFQSTMGHAMLTRDLQKLPPQALEQVVNTERARATAAGATPEQRKRADHVAKLEESIRTAVNKDPLTHAHKVGLEVPILVPGGGAAPGSARAGQEEGLPPTGYLQPVRLEQLNFAAPDADQTLARRAESARAVANYYKQPPQFFTKVERDGLKDALNNGGPVAMRTLGMIYKAFGNDTILAMKEINEAGAPEAAIMGKMMIDGAGPQVIQDAAEGLKIRRQQGFISHVDAKMRTPEVQVASQALRATPGVIDPIVRTADAVYETRHRSQGKKDFDPALYRNIIKEVMGETEVNGRKFGGLGKQGSSFGDGKWSSEVLVPAGVAQDGFDKMVGALTPADLSVIGRPLDGKGQPLPIADVKRATWVSVSGSRYILQTGSGQTGEPQYATGKDGQPFVVDVSRVLPTLKTRVPDIFADHGPKPREAYDTRAPIPEQRNPNTGISPSDSRINRQTFGRVDGAKPERALPEGEATTRIGDMMTNPEIPVRGRRSTMPTTLRD